MKKNVVKLNLSLIFWRPLTARVIFLLEKGKDSSLVKWRGTVFVKIMKICVDEVKK